jgi:hypothetical protein
MKGTATVTNVTHVVGVDTGLVTTGVVRMVFRSKQQAIEISHEAVKGPDSKAVKDWVENPLNVKVPPAVYIEAYNPRHHYKQDQRMVISVQAMRQFTGGTVLPNTAVKKVVRRGLMELVGVWSFGTVTHHQDLRSAARIALLGMLKDQQMNQLLADVVRDHLAGNTWSVS